MTSISDILKRAVPVPVKAPLRAAHRSWTFARTLRRYVALVERGADADTLRPLLPALVYGWGNAGWSAVSDYLVACLRGAGTATTGILECGSGLSTLLVAPIAARRGVPYVALEHTPEWGRRVGETLARFGLNDVVVDIAPLQDYGDFEWYTAPSQAVAPRFDLVICDGPPAATRGGRYGLVPVMEDRFAPGCRILIDDAVRESERTVAARWAAHLGAEQHTFGHDEPYIELRLGSQRGASTPTAPAPSAPAAP